MIFSHNDYKCYLKERLQKMPKEGRGELQKISKHLKMHSTRLSHVFNGDEHLTLEQGIGLSAYLGLNELEADYFMVLLQHAKAGTPDLKKFFDKKRKELLERSARLAERLPSTRKLNDSEKALFYSNWFYSAVRLATSLPGLHTLDTLAERFCLPRVKVAEIIEFLVTTGLCEIREQTGLAMGPKSTHLDASSPLVPRLHANWRIKAMERHPSLNIDNELALTSPMSIEAKDVRAIRETLVEMIEKAAAYADTDKPDRLYCLNVDWFQF